MATATAAPRLSEEESARLVALIQDADSVELKLTVPEVDQRSTVTALEMDPLDAEIRQVYFFDTPDLRLNDQGLVVRARRIQGKGGDSVVKLRPIVPSELPRRVRTSRGFSVEVDAMPGGFVCSGTLKQAVDATAVKAVAAGTKAARKLFSKEQRAFFGEHAPEGVRLDELSILGPIFVLKLKYTPKGLGRRLVAEMWLYPDDTRILELSTKCAPAEAFDVAARARAFLSERGVDLEGEQQTKTKTALEFFARPLAGAAGAPSEKRRKQGE
jgi:hypothetical protein